MKTSTSSPRVWTVAETSVAELEHVCFSYDGERVLDEVSLRIARGDFLGIIGPNGAGKTTLLRIVLGLLRPSCGHVRLFGPDVAKFRDWQRFAYTPKKAVAFEARSPASVFEVVMSGRVRLAGLGRRFVPPDYPAGRRALAAGGVV